MYKNLIKKLTAINLSIAGLVVLCLVYFGKDAFIYYVFNPAGRYQNQIVMYSTPVCPYCKKLRQCLDDSNLVYLEKNINDDRLADLEHEALGGAGVPITLIGEDSVNGVNIKKLNSILKKTGRTLSCAEHKVPVS